MATSTRPAGESSGSGRLRGRVALVTGAGRGLGRAHALELARHGARVVVNDLGTSADGYGRDEVVAETVASEIRALGGDAVADTSDIGSFAGAARAVATTVETFDRIDILVNNAGIIRTADIRAIRQQDLQQMWDVHVVGTVGTMQAAYEHMLQAGFGRILNTTSESAFSPIASTVAYAAVKAAVVAATKAVAAAGAAHGITANALSPGALTRTSAAEIARRRSGQQLDLDAAHVARVVAVLVSPEAAFLSGAVIHSAGGRVREYVTERRRETAALDSLGRLVREFGVPASPGR